MTAGFFITGTDTNVGKTWTSVALLRRWRGLGYRAAGMKPVAAGCEWRDGVLMNQDALLLQANSEPTPPYELVNPYAFEAPVSPHLACGAVEVQLATIETAYAALRRQADRVLVEGAGGWLSPLGGTLDNAGLALALQLPVILVVGMRLGCLNQARLSLLAIRLSKAHCVGWVAVCIDPAMQAFEANLAYLQRCLDAPLLGVLPHAPDADFDLLARCIYL